MHSYACQQASCSNEHTLSIGWHLNVSDWRIASISVRMQAACCTKFADTGWHLRQSMQAGAAPQLQQLQDGGTQRAQGGNRASSMACLALPHLHQQKPLNLSY